MCRGTIPRSSDPARRCRAPTLEQSRAIVERFRLDLPESVVRALRDGANETPKPGNQIFTRTSFSLAARPADVFNRVEEAQIEGEARTVAAAHAQCAKELAASGRRAVILSGGGARHCARGLAFGRRIGWRYRWNRGGAGAPDDPAGAFVDTTTLARARGLGLDPAAFLADNNSTEFFEKLGDLVVPGPTLTNVNDFRAVLVEGA
jgi:glycerate 2-kinase